MPATCHPNFIAGQMSEFSPWVAMHKHTAGLIACPRHTGDGYVADEAKSLDNRTLTRRSIRRQHPGAGRTVALSTDNLHAIAYVPGIAIKPLQIGREGLRVTVGSSTMGNYRDTRWQSGSAIWSSARWYANGNRTLQWAPCGAISPDDGSPLGYHDWTSPAQPATFGSGTLHYSAVGKKLRQ